MINFSGDTLKFKKTIKFFNNKLKTKDFSRLKTIKLYFGKTHDGACYYPSRSRKKYFIFCRLDINNIFPESLEYYIRPKLIKKGLYFSRTIKTDVEIVQNHQESMVWLLAHELFHFLRDTKQIPGKNTQAQANEYGFKCLREFKRLGKS